MNHYFCLFSIIPSRVHETTKFVTRLKTKVKLTSFKKMGLNMKKRNNLSRALS